MRNTSLSRIISFMSWKNILFKVLTALPAKKNVREPSSNPRILVVSTTGLGDSLWGTPTIRAIKKHYPQSYLALLTSPIGEQVYRNSPYIDALFTVQNPALFSCIKVLPKLRKQSFDTALIFHLSQRPVLPFVCLAGPSTIVGTKHINKGLDFLLTHSIEKDPIHEIERRLNLAKEIGIPSHSYQMELFLTAEENNAALEHLPNHPYIVGIHPGAKDPFKRWNPKHFITLGRRLVKEKNAKILITGDTSEAALAQSIADNIPGALSLAGKLPMRVTAALIEKLHLFISNDTGPMHISYAMGTPTIALFAPTDSLLCGPYKISHGTIIQKSRTCIPCLQKKCQLPLCMEQISPEEVWEKIHA